MKNKTILSIIFVLICLILIKAFIHSSKYISDDYNKEYSLFIVSKYKESDSMVAYNVLLGNDKFIMKIYQNDNMDLEKCINLKYGDLINVTGRIIVPEYMNNPGEFNYKYYLYSNNIHGEIGVKKIISLGKAEFGIKDKMLSHIYNYKEYLGEVLTKYLSYKNIELAKSIIYGETLRLDEETKNNFEETGLSHIMAVSGANITSIVTIISILLELLKVKGKVINIISLLLILIFVILTGSSLTTLRAGIMLGCSGVFRLFNKKINPLKSLILSVMIILFFYPYSIFNTGFILSFLATFGIIAFIKSFRKITDKVIYKIHMKWLKKILEIIFLNLWLTLSVQIMIIPIQINSFNIFSPTQIVFNICLSGITNIITILGAVFILFSYIPVLNFLVVKITNMFISILLSLINIFSSISLNIPVMDLPVIVVILYYCIVLSFMTKIYLKEFLSRRKYEINKKSWKKYSIVQIALILLMVIITITNTFYFRKIASFVYFLNVGQGETSYIKCGKSGIIVDIGSLKTNLAFNTVSNYFKMKNISGVDAIILSHMHTDHINGLERYLANYDVGIVLYSKPAKENEVYFNFKELMEKYNVRCKEVKSDEAYKFGDIKIDIILPRDDLLNVEDNINANSLVCKVSVKDKNIMYMGDATKDTEKEILKVYNFKSIDILKVGHHGSKTSTSEEYINKVKPKYAVISSKKSYYNHPHESVIELLKKYNVKIYITEKIGAIKYNF